MSDQIINTTDVQSTESDLSTLNELVDIVDTEEQTLDSIKKQTRKMLFIATLMDKAVAGNVVVACEKTGYPHGTMYKWRAEDEHFRKLWDEAVIQGDAHIMSEAEYALRKKILEGDIQAIKYTLNNRGSRRWGEAAQTVHNTQINTTIVTEEKRKVLNAEFEQFIEAKTLKTVSPTAVKVEVNRP